MKRLTFVLLGLIVVSVLLLWPLAASAQFNGRSGSFPSLAVPFGLIASCNLLYQAFRIRITPAINIVAKFLLFIAAFLLTYEVYIYLL
jgi:ABC-type Mn2+/Zn2+ transport system permease subunit